MKYNRYAYTLLCAILMCCMGNKAFSQVGVTPSLGPCGVVTALTATVLGDIPTGSGITVDDGYSGLIPIGFTYNFYGVNYNQLVIGSNGVLNFTAGLAGAYCPWSITATLLGNPNMRNCICGPWSDIYIPAGGTITYSTIGTAPNRKFMATWCATHMYSCTAQWETFQIIIYETTNIAETHIAHRTLGCGWNGDRAIVGVQNAAGTIATVAPGRDIAPTWSAINEAWRFTPSGPTYTVGSIPFAPVPYASSLVYWYDSTTGAFLGTGTTLPITPVPGVTYKACALGCSDTSYGFYHVSSTATPSGATAAALIHSVVPTNPTYCGACDGVLRLQGGIAPGTPDTVYYSIGGVPQPPVYTMAASDSSITLTGLCAGVYSSIYVNNGSPCPSNIVGPITLTDPPVDITSQTSADPSECGLCNGNIVLFGLLPGHSINVSYNKNGIPQTPVVALASAAGSITLPGLCAGSYTGILAVMGGVAACSDTGADVILVDPPISISSQSSTSPTECGKCDGTILLHGLYPGHAISVSFMRNGMPQPPQVITSASDGSLLINNLCAGVYSNIVVTVNGTCTANALDETLVDPVLTAGFTYTSHLGCTGDSIIITNSSTPPGYTSVWSYGDGTSDSAATNPLHVYASQGTYTIGLVYHNPYGCAVTASNTVTFNHPLTSVFTSVPAVCLGVPVSFTNTSVPTGATYYWTFGDGSTSTDMNPVHAYAAGGDYVAQLTVTDGIPCSITSSAPVQVVAVSARTDFHDTTVCLIDSMQLLTYVTVIPSTVTTIAYQWAPTNNVSDPTAAQPMFFGVPADYTYTFTATALPLGCTASDVETIHVKPPIILTHLTTDQTIAIGSSIQLNADSALYYVWSPNDGTLDNPNINNPVATPTDSVNHYMVIGTSLYGCKDTAYVTIRVDPAVIEFMPAAFTPNGDGLNDLFRVFNLRTQKLVDFRIFNRWGHEVFHTIDPKKGWDGTLNGEPQDMGVYFYQVIVAHPDGAQKSYSGNVTLIR